MRIAFLNPPFLPQYGRYSREQRSPAITKSGTFYYPMWLSYAAGFIEARGHVVRLWDAPAKRWSTEHIMSLLREFQPDMVVVATSTPSVYSDLSQAAAIKAIKPEVFIVLVGAHVSALPSETLQLNDLIDAVVVGEYELTLAELIGKIDAGEDLQTIAGLVYRRRSDHAITANETRGLNRDLDGIPWVTRTYKKHLDYRDYFYSGNRFPLVAMVSSRGCPNNCIFCSYPQTVTGHSHRTRCVEDVVDEMEYAVRELSPLGEIMFEDDTFTADRERTISLSEAILRRGVKIRWSCNARADLDLETMMLMSRAGCRSLLVGFESGSQLILDRMNKGTDRERYQQFMKDSRKAGLLVNGAFLIGMPGETKETMHKTLELAKTLNPDVAQFFPVMVYPGTTLYELYRAKGYFSPKDFRAYLNEGGLHNCIVELPDISSREMVEFCDCCRRTFYLRPNYMLYKLFQTLSEPGEGIRTLKAARIFFKHLLNGTKTHV